MSFLNIFSLKYILKIYIPKKIRREIYISNKGELYIQLKNDLNTNKTLLKCFFYRKQNEKMKAKTIRVVPTKFDCNFNIADILSGFGQIQ